MKTNLIKEKSFGFSLNAIDLYKNLIQEKEYIISKQFLRSATSIGANVNEATAAISLKDFTAKMSIASKEARETLYWINLMDEAKFIEFDYAFIRKENEEVINILTAIVKTCQKKIKSQK